MRKKPEPTKKRRERKGAHGRLQSKGNGDPRTLSLLASFELPRVLHKEEAAARLRWTWREATRPRRVRHRWGDPDVRAELVTTRSSRPGTATAASAPRPPLSALLAFVELVSERGIGLIHQILTKVFALRPWLKRLAAMLVATRQSRVDHSETRHCWQTLVKYMDGNR